MRLALLLLLLASPVAAQIALEPADMELPPGYPPKLGTAELVEAGKVRVMTTYDFSIGAFDASAWFGTGLDGHGFFLMAYPDENPDATKGILRLFAPLETMGPARSEAALVEISMVEDISGRRWTSAGKPATLVIESFTPEEPGATSGYGHVTGQYAATICSGDGDPPVVAKTARCREISGRFDTGMQFEP